MHIDMSQRNALFPGRMTQLVGRGPAMGGPESDTQCLHLKQNLGILYTLTIPALERQDRRILGSQGQQPSLISEPWAGMSLKTWVDKC